jgi:5'-deoxynucleotidase YfbR-like HD superfamily hydrolase
MTSLQHPGWLLVFVEESENVLHHLLLAGLAGLAVLEKTGQAQGNKVMVHQH